MKTRILAIVITGCLLIGCGTPPVREKRAASPRSAVVSEFPDFPETKYLYAKGIGQSEPEAGRQAMAALSAIFEARIESEVSTRAESVMEDSVEAFKKSVTEAVQVRSGVTLAGASIGRTWQEGAYHYALAVLDKSKARIDWMQQIDQIDNRITGEFAVYNDPQATPYLRLKAANTILLQSIDRQVLESRLRVIDGVYPSPNAGEIAEMIRKMPEIRSRMRICVEMSGPGGGTIRDRIAGRLTSEGFVLTAAPDRSDVLIRGVSRIDSLEMNRENWQFVRATASLAVMDQATGARVAEISENIRAAHLTAAEATRKAVAKISAQVAERVVQSFVPSGN